jgi:hypothetical protein
MAWRMWLGKRKGREKRGKQVNQYVRSTSLIQALYWAHHHH